MITFHDATEQEIDFVLANLWERGKREALMVGVDSVAELRKWLVDYPPDNLYTIVYQEKPIAIAGSSCANDTHFTTFLATKDFKKMGKPLTRFIKKFISERVNALEIKRLEIWSASDHPEAGKWFNVLRFYLNAIDPPFHKYLYVPKNSIAHKA